MSGFLDLLGLELVDASIPRAAPLAEAARLLGESRVGALAVLDEERHVTGLFGEIQLLRLLFPRYLAELRHTAYLRDDPARLAQCFASVRDEPVGGSAGEAITVDAGSSATHVAERFLHSDLPAIAVVRHGEYIGMLSLADFCRALMRPGARATLVERTR